MPYPDVSRMAELLQKEIESARAASQEATQKLSVLSAIADVFPENLSPTKVYVYCLYGSSASIHFGTEMAGYGKPEDRLTLTQAGELMKSLPPVPLTYCRDGCVWFQPTETIKKEIKETTPVFGAVLEIDPSRHIPHTNVKWFTKLRENLIVEIECVLIPSDYPVHARIEYEWYKDGEFKSIRTQSLVQSANHPHFYLDQRIKYGSGSHKHPGKWCLYWPDYPTLYDEPLHTPADAHMVWTQHIVNKNEVQA